MSGKQRPERLGAAPYGKCQLNMNAVNKRNARSALLIFVLFFGWCGSAQSAETADDDVLVGINYFAGWWEELCVTSTILVGMPLENEGAAHSRVYIEDNVHSVVDQLERPEHMVHGTSPGSCSQQLS